jgi:hypothetical protein
MIGMTMLLPVCFAVGLAALAGGFCLRKNKNKTARLALCCAGAVLLAGSVGGCLLLMFVFLPAM